MERYIKYELMKDFDRKVLDTDLQNIFSFNPHSNSSVYKIVDAFEGFTIGAIEIIEVPSGLELRIGLNSDFRYKGLASSIIKNVVDKVGKSFSNTKYMVCYISMDNKASKKAFEKSGFWLNEDNSAMAEGYLEYNILNPHYSKKKTGNDKLNFINKPDEKGIFKIEQEDIGTHKLSFKRTFEGMEVRCDLAIDRNCNGDAFVATLTDVLNSLSPLFPYSEYFIYKINSKDPFIISSYRKLFNDYGYKIDTSMSNDTQLVVKYPNSEYHVSVNESLTRKLIKIEGEKND